MRPLPLLIPVYTHSRRGMVTVDFGLYVYDMLSLGRSLPGHQRLSSEEALERVPGLAREGLVGACVYSDAQATFVERLVIENALSAAAAGATIETHTEVAQILLAGDRVSGVVVRNTRTGEVSTREGRTLVNAAGSGWTGCWRLLIGPCPAF